MNPISLLSRSSGHESALIYSRIDREMSVAIQPFHPSAEYHSLSRSSRREEALTNPKTK
jgi:hypothetical protein